MGLLGKFCGESAVSRLWFTNLGQLTRDQLTQASNGSRRIISISRKM